MISVYEKDVKVLKSILIMVVVFSTAFVSYVFFRYTLKDSYALNSDYSMQIVYNEGRRNCKLTNVYPGNDQTTYNFSVIGYNKTDQDISYKIFAKKGDILNGVRYLDEEITLTMSNAKKTVLFGPLEPLGLTDFGISLGEVIVRAKTNSFLHEYTLSISYVNGEELVDTKYLERYYTIDIIIEKMF